MRDLYGIKEGQSITSLIEGDFSIPFCIIIMINQKLLMTSGQFCKE